MCFQFFFCKKKAEKNKNEIGFSCSVVIVNNDLQDGNWGKWETLNGQFSHPNSCSSI